MQSGEPSGNGLLFTVVLHLLCLSAFGFEMPMLKTNLTRSSDFYLRLEDVYAKKQPEEFKSNNISFAGKRVVSPGNLTLDYRCDHGMKVSFRWTNYGPYASLVRPKSPAKVGGVGLVGIFPQVIAKALSECCHTNTRVEVGEYIKTIKGLEKSLSINGSYDMMFPVGLQNMRMTVFKDLPVVPLLRAPRTTLVVPESSEESGKTFELFRTVGMAWPILAFIFFAAVVSGGVMWVLDHDEFPVTFLSGLWEGFWWAVVTMTTVGYGDRAPRSVLGRLYCVIWIVIGMSIIAIFTALITASLSASIQYRFVVHGSVMGSVDGSQEERIGTGMNADIKTFETPKKVLEGLVDTKELEVAIMDNYLLSHFHKIIKREPVRVQSNLEQPINYGLVMAPNSNKLAACFRDFVRNNPQDIFDIIRSNLNPLKNPTDDISEELKASQGFLGEKAFRMILYCLAGSLGVFFLMGILWEFVLSKLICGSRRPAGKSNGTAKMETEEDAADMKPRKSIMQSLIGFRLAHRPGSTAEGMRNLETIKNRTIRIRQLVQEYEEFYEKWLEKLEDTTDEDELNGFADTFPQNKTSILMVAYTEK